MPTEGTAKGYVLVRRTVVDPGQAKEYLETAFPLAEAAGGRYLVRGATAEVMEGAPEPPGSAWVVIEFDSLQAARDFYQSEAYSASRRLAQTAFERDYLLVEGLPGV